MSLVQFHVKKLELNRESWKRNNSDVVHRQKPEKRVTVTAMLIGLALAIGTSTTSYATEGTEETVSIPLTETNEVLRLAMQLDDGSWQIIEPAEPEAQIEDVVVTPYLLEPYDWTQCWMINNQDYVIRSMWWSNQGTSDTMNLTCGNTSFGYKHIVDQNHDDHWDTILSNAVAAGFYKWDYDINTWDDLMYFAVVNMVSGVGTSYNSTSMKGCQNRSFGLYNTSTGSLAYEFRAEVVVSLNNKRVITSFPSSRTYCNDW